MESILTRRFLSISSERIYRVDAYRGVAVCNCPGYRSHGHCRHEKEVRDEMEENTQALVPIEVTPPKTTLPQLHEIELMSAIAQRVSQAEGMIPDSIKTPDQAFAIMLAGWELGARPMSSFRHIFTVNGKTEPDAQLMMGVVKARDPSANFIFHEMSSDRCDATLERAGHVPLRMDYTMEDATQSGQANKPGPWKNYTADMLRWACIKRLCRIGAPDLINAVAGVSVENASDLLNTLPPAMESITQKAETVTEAIKTGDDALLYNKGDQPPVEVVPPKNVDKETGEIVEPVEPEVIPKETPPEKAKAVGMMTCEHKSWKNVAGAVTCQACGANRHDVLNEKAEAQPDVNTWEDFRTLMMDNELAIGDLSIVLDTPVPTKEGVMAWLGEENRTPGDLIALCKATQEAQQGK